MLYFISLLIVVFFMYSFIMKGSDDSGCCNHNCNQGRTCPHQNKKQQ